MMLASSASADPVLDAFPNPPGMSVPGGYNETDLVSVYNSGDMAALNGKLRFELPPELTFQATASPPRYDPHAPNFWSSTIPSLAASSNSVMTSDAAGRAQRSDRPARLSCFLDYDPATGLPTLLDHPDNNDDVFSYTARMLTYDANVWLTVVAGSDADTHTFAYDVLHGLTGITSPDATTRAFACDALHRATSAMNERGHPTAWVCDDNSGGTTVTDPDATPFESDGLHPVTRIVARFCEDATFTADARQLAFTVTNRNGDTTTFV